MAKKKLTDTTTVCGCLQSITSDLASGSFENFLSDTKACYPLIGDSGNAYACQQALAATLESGDSPESVMSVPPCSTVCPAPSSKKKK